MVVFLPAVQAIHISQPIRQPYFAPIEIEADEILLAKAVDGVYDSDPKTNPDAKKFDEISIQEAIERSESGRYDCIHLVRTKLMLYLSMKRTVL